MGFLTSFKALFPSSLFCAMLAGCSACSSTGYLLHAARGQLEISNRARPLAEVIADERTSPRLKTLLNEIARVKTFGERHGIKPTRNYETYVDLKRSAASYVVSASHPLRFESKEWSFPLVGKFPYLGWFDLEKARAYAEALRQQQLDVDLRGAGAFSTLGWFRDPVLSTMIPEGDGALGELVDVVIHESVHATIYLTGQAPFNESLAMFVARGLTEAYLKEFYPREPQWLDTYLRDEKESESRAKKMRDAFLELDLLYRSSAPDSEKRAKKNEILARLGAAVGAKRELNNATLIQYRTYHGGKDYFGDLFRARGGDWPEFMRCLQRAESDWFGQTQWEDFAPVIDRLKTECAR